MANFLGAAWFALFVAAFQAGTPAALAHLKFHTAWISLGERDFLTKQWVTAKMCDVLAPDGSVREEVWMPAKGDRLKCTQAMQLSITDFSQDGEAKRNVRPTSGKIADDDVIGLLSPEEVVDVCDVSIEPPLMVRPVLDGVWARVGSCH